MKNNIGKKVKVLTGDGQEDLIMTIQAVVGDLYVCKSEEGYLTRCNEDEVKIMEE